MMKSKQEKNIFIVLLIALAFFFVKKTKANGPIPDVEVGEGSFGDFGTDGILDDYLQDQPVKTPNYVAGFTTPKFKNLTIKKPSVNQEIRKTTSYVEKSCSVCA